MTWTCEIPYGAYWSTPFAKWQGSLAGLHSMAFGAYVARHEMAKRKLDPAMFDHGVLGMTVPQKQSFYGLPWFAGLIGAPQLAGPTINQACATGARCLMAAAQEVEQDDATTALVATCDRISNGPHIVYPEPGRPGGTADHENWVLDNFGCDPLGKHGMLQTAENVAAKYQITTAEQHAVVLRRTEQYRQALANDRAFQKRYMSLPFEVPRPDMKRSAGTMEGDEGITLSTAEGLGRLKPVMAGGTVTFGGQTHPADGSACMVVTTRDKARELSADKAIRVKILGFGSARADLAYMPEAPVKAAKVALARADLAIGDIDAIKSHNPFAVNDIVFARETGADIEAMNNYGCSLIWGHPQGPTGLRAIIELIEELALRGGGRGLFHGCAAGDTSMAVVVSVEAGKV